LGLVKYNNPLYGRRSCADILIPKVMNVLDERAGVPISIADVLAPELVRSSARL
jgi:hypothetical protein